MAKQAKALSALEVGRLTSPGLHAVGGVTGLYLNVKPSGSRQWILRIVIAGKRSEIGLGGFPSVTLAGAVAKARELREKVAQGIDLLAERRQVADALREAKRQDKTFAWCVEEYLKGLEGTFRNAKHQAQWRSTLATYALPTLGTMPVSNIKTQHVLEVLQPIWISRAETASRLRGRIERVLDWSGVLGYRTGANAARWKGNLDALLAKPKAIRAVKPRNHHASLPYDQMSALMPRLEAVSGIGAQALRFTIYTAARSGEVRGARWSEIDLENGVFSIPASRMKAGVEHRVPLSSQALELLKALPRGEGDALVFPSPRGKVLSDMTLSAVLRRLGMDVTVHGFRSTFRTWAAERTAFPREVAEASLAHTLGNKVEASYLRSTHYEQRKRLMQVWADFVHTPAGASAKVLELKHA